MSILPIFNSWVVFLGLVSLIWWRLSSVLIFLGLLFVSVGWLISEFEGRKDHYLSAFWLFIFSEVMAFVSLFMTCLWSKRFGDSPISVGAELPVLGCFLLIGSSVTVTAFYCHLSTLSGEIFLGGTIALGVGFIAIQLVEFFDGECDVLYSVYLAVSFCIVGLHFFTCFGRFSLSSIVFYCGSNIWGYYVDLAVWYWHFVDYIWLLVFAVVYFFNCWFPGSLM